MGFNEQFNKHVLQPFATIKDRISSANEDRKDRTRQALKDRLAKDSYFSQDDRPPLVDPLAMGTAVPFSRPSVAVMAGSQHPLNFAAVLAANTLYPKAQNSSSDPQVAATVSQLSQLKAAVDFRNMSV